MSRLLIPAIAAIALGCSACGPSAPPSDPTPSAAEPVAQTPDPSPSAAAASPAAATGTPVTYACTDASTVSVAWGDDQARVGFADGRTISLPKAQSASKGGGEVFVGDTVSLQRDGDGIRLFDGEGAARQCSAQASTD